ncbi:MAG TPA: hypothetical protein VHP63_07610, partial [candidate division Zixibacteria bacterium]|nr:hypothetical protein [candidate division Zixibacteria bacterium]
SVGFTIKKDAQINIDAVGIRSNQNKDMLAYAWIINSDTRKLVWEMENRRTDRFKSKSNVREIKTTESLKAGKYELYYSVQRPDYWEWNQGGSDFFGALGRLLDGGSDRIRRSDVRDCFITLTSDALTAADIERFEIDGGLPGALIRLTKLEDEQYIKQGFELTKPASLRIYALIEFPNYSDGTPADFAWIINLDTREKIWECDKWNVEYAGGSEKNQLHDEVVKFDKGRYALYVATDDSHSFEEFNANPPYDPMNWGVTILPADNFDKASFASIEIPGRGEALIDFTRARNDDFHEQSFKLNQETKVNVYAIGEMANSDREFADYGYIVDALSGKTVWEMDNRNTTHAGGAEKNRMFDDIVTLPAGTYTAYYQTDGSHAYRNWNSTSPFDAESYGLAIYSAGKSKPAGFSLVKEDDIYNGTNVLARIIRVGDGERRHARFTLAKPTKVNIYALGEGTGGEMYDYAYIVDLNNEEDIWEMHYRRTNHAGGAEKNRMAKALITLEPGEYEVIY